MGIVMLKDTALDIGIDSECPICSENPRYNAKALAAIEEGRAITRGDIPSVRHKPHEFEQVWNELLED